ncbi:MAG: S-(hydroxymethyl)glutathione dehydrogenase / alcohol dehydrogenase [Mycobacterium sp.]|jgi:S-(hydroxymethyl)glutathione dehydrogenase/alcohol dehydrogenase|nr:S-(hydroxymethyl)glutathione dehydrogenase / alcohol dehydrogenase [Mycobacterium sp.]
MKTRGALIWDFNQPWSVEEIDIGEPRSGEVKVQMEAAGLCHSEHHVVTGDIPMAAFPMLGGHEGAGVVIEISEGVDDLVVGDHVAASFIPSCGKCPSCHAGERNLCDLGMGLMAGTAVSDGTFRIQTNERNVYPYALLGTFAPYIVVHQTSLVKIDPAIPFETAALVSCGVTTGFGSATRAAEVRPGDDVAVVGLGGVGMSAVLGAVNCGARRIFAVDPVDWKRDQALKFGATHAYSDIDSALMAIAQITVGRMARKVIVTVGRAEGADLEKYLSVTSKGGTCVVTAMGSVVETDVSLNLALLTLMQKRLQGTIFGGGNPQHDIPLLLSMYQAGRLNLDDMVTRRYSLDQINDGYRDMLEGRNIRGIIRFTDADR